MVAERVKRQEPCAHEDCGSRRFYIGDDGFTYCDQGHQQSERGTVVTNDTGELVILGRKSRRIDSEGESIATSRSGFSKSQAYEHYFLCLQLVLRKQLVWLIETKSFPAELELVVRDLWALRIQNVRPGAKAGMETEDDTRSHMFSSQSEFEASTDAEGLRSSDGQSRRRESNKDNTQSLNVLELIALLHTGMILLHLPVSTADLCQWISTGELLYYYSSKAAPVDLRRRLPAYLQRQLEPESVLKGQDLQFAVHRTISQLSLQYGMHCPAINDTLLLYRWLKILALPIEIFAAVRSISRMLHVDFIHAANARNSLAKMPELRLMALLVVATKLLFPSDAIERYSTSTEDPSALAMDWDAWTVAADQEAVGDHSGYQEAFTATETDCLAMVDQQLDQYLDWYQQNIASEYVSERGPAAHSADFRRAMLSMFPASSTIQHDSAAIAKEEDEIGNNTAKRLGQSQSKLMPRAMVHEQDDTGGSLRIGSLYRRYRTLEELLTTGSNAVQKLYELAAQHSGVSIELVIRAVVAIERQLEREEINRRDLSTDDGHELQGHGHFQ